jgi:hypothetical protein
MIDQHTTWRKVEERLATETDRVLRSNLEQLLVHMKGEAALDLDAVMATVAEDAHYHSYRTDDPASNPKGKAAVLKFYEDFAKTGAYRLELDIDRLIVDRHSILTEGVMRMAYPGRTLEAMGIDVDDTEADYLYETRMAVIWPINEDGLFLGEDTYVSRDGFAGIAARKLDPADIVLYRPEPATAATAP